MYIGCINEGVSPKFYRAGTDIPFEPEQAGDGLIWKWSRVFDSAIDIKYCFDGERYVGAVEHGITGACEISLFVDGVKVACHSEELVRVNMSGRELVIRARGELKDIHLKGAEIFGFYPEDDEPLLLPRPKDISVGAEQIKIGDIVGEGEDAGYAAHFLLDSLNERFGYDGGEGATVRFELCPEYEAERYTVSTREGEIAVRAASRLALLWGACRIIDLWDDGCLPEINIDDKPDVPMRGFHMGLPRADRLEFTKRFFRYVLLPLGYNHVIVEFNGAMRFDSLPEIGEKWIEAERLYREGKQARIQHAEMGADGTVIEKAQVRELLSVLEDYGIEVIPEVQSFGHVQYLTYAHPEIAEVEPKSEDEVDERNQDALPVNFCAHAYCPSREDSMRYIYAIIDEIVEVARPRRYVHIGHDEIYQVGSCPVCAKKGKARVYVEHIMALYNYMKAKGLGIMIWSDMLHEGILPYSDETAVAKAELPKDIVLLDFTWYFKPDRDIEEELYPYGFKVMMGNFYSSHYPRFSKRIAARDMIGGEVSTWIAVSEEDYAEYGKFFDLAYTSEMLWNAYGYDERNRAAYTALIGQCILPEMRDLLHGRYELYSSYDLNDAEALGCFPGEEERIPEELSYLYLTEPKGVLSVGEKYDRLVFEHATLNPVARVAWKPLYTVGHYTVVYEDGERVDIPIKYAGGILYWRSHYGEPLPQQYYRHMGYIGTWISDPTYESRTAEGEPILLLGQVWDNPHPEKVIKELAYTPEEGDYARLISAGVLGIKK